MEDIIFNEIITRMSKEDILRKAERDNEKPFGYIIEYIRDEYNIPKPDGWHIAERICKFYGI